jgi:hypothetical protein
MISSIKSNTDTRKPAGQQRFSGSAAVIQGRLTNC